VPVFSEGRHLFRQLNCTGCHILDSFPGNRNTGSAAERHHGEDEPGVDPEVDPLPARLAAEDEDAEPVARSHRPGREEAYAPGSPEYATWETQMKSRRSTVASYLIERSENPDQSRPHAT
jgi:hypothetical protein